MKKLTNVLLNSGFRLSETYIQRNNRVKKKLAESSNKRVTKDEAYAQYDRIKSASNR